MLQGHTLAIRCSSQAVTGIIVSLTQLARISNLAQPKYKRLGKHHCPKGRKRTRHMIEQHLRLSRVVVGFDEIIFVKHMV